MLGFLILNKLNLKGRYILCMDIDELYIDYFGHSWYSQLKDTLHSNYFNELRKYLKEEKSKNVVLPQNIRLAFRAFRDTPYGDVRVVVIGQDIYHDPGRFDGLAFSNGNTKNGRISPSLVNIINEVKRDYPQSKTYNDLTSWAKQGVFLINVGLTVVQGRPGSHIDRWKPFMLDVVKQLNKKNGLIYLLWGRFAQKYKQFIDPDNNHILEAGHPSPLNTTNPFRGCGHFKKVNDIISGDKIEW